MAGYRGKTFPCVHGELNTLKSENTKSLDTQACRNEDMFFTTQFLNVI